jgi:hypothetical protein
MTPQLHSIGYIVGTQRCRLPTVIVVKPRCAHLGTSSGRFMSHNAAIAPPTCQLWRDCTEHHTPSVGHCDTNGVNHGFHRCPLSVPHITPPSSHTFQRPYALEQKRNTTTTGENVGYKTFSANWSAASGRNPCEQQPKSVLHQEDVVIVQGRTLPIRALQGGQNPEGNFPNFSSGVPPRCWPSFSNISGLPRDASHWVRECCFLCVIGL